MGIKTAVHLVPQHSFPSESEKNRSRSKSFAIVLITVLLLCSAVPESLTESMCVGDNFVEEENKITIHSKREESGEWVTTISSYRDLERVENTTNLDVKSRVISCGRKQILHITATIRGSPLEVEVKKLRFHDRGGKNAVIGNEGTTVLRKNELSDEGFGGVLTNRALRNDEMFELRVDKFISKYDTSLGIGVTYHNLKNIDYRDWMMCGTIMLYNNKLYENGFVTKEYGPNLRTLKVGDRVGLVKKRNGDLHFFVNGVDLGVATSNITYPVYGVLDLFGKAVQITIV